ncbi:hypothetical protein GCM10027168_03800 [Streptomyces capparidis]
MGFPGEERRMTLLATRVGRAAAVPALAGLLLAAVGCTGSSGDAGDGTRTRAASAGESATPLPPGKFRVLPEPCGAVSNATLRLLMPASAEQDRQQGQDAGTDNDDALDLAGGDPAEGRPTLTFDTDRRAGCEWSWGGDGLAGSRSLRIDLTRVVSYDSGVSDEEQAEEDYLASASAAHVPMGGAVAPSSSAEVSQDGSSDTSPRLVGGIGDEAFMAERAASDDSAPHREIRLVFRKDNVIVTVDYQQWPAEGDELPASGELQRSAHLVAQDLAGRLSDG